MQLKTAKLVFDIGQDYGAPDTVGSFNRWFFESDEGDAILAISGDSVSMFIKSSNNTWKSTVSSNASDVSRNEISDFLKKINARAITK